MPHSFQKCVTDPYIPSTAKRYGAWRKQAVTRMNGVAASQMAGKSKTHHTMLGMNSKANSNNAFIREYNPNGFEV